MEELARVFKALSNENRLRIVRLLMQREYRCCEGGEEECTLEEPSCDFGELTDLLGIHKSTLSHHLKELRYAGLIKTVKEGRSVSVRINGEKLCRIQKFFELNVATSGIS